MSIAASVYLWCCGGSEYLGTRVRTYVHLCLHTSGGVYECTWVPACPPTYLCVEMCLCITSTERVHTCVY